VAYKNWIHRRYALPLNKNNKKKELNNVINIAINNGYRKEDIMYIHNKLKLQSKLENNAEKEQKWVSFTYTGNYIRKITKLFKHTNLKIAFKATSTIEKLLKEKQGTNSHEQSGIYKITCQSCHKVYIGQMGRNLTSTKNT
jgi:AICAR transformylase/IMP cyclohydrolase PurH